MNYSRGGSIHATGGVAAETRRETAGKAAGGVPFLKIMAAVILMILVGFAWLVLNGYRFS